MVFGGYLQSSREPCIVKDYGHNNLFKRLEPRGRINLLTLSLSSHLSRQDYWTLHVSNRIKRQTYHVPLRQRTLNCKSLFAFPSSPDGNIALKTAALALTRSYNALQRSTPLYQLVPAIGVIAFALWGLGPVMRLSRKLFFHRNDYNWRKSKTHYIFTSYLQPLLLWSGATLICRALDPFILPSQASQAVKQRLLNFVRSLSTVMAIAFCLSSLIQQAQSYFMETNDSNDAGNVGFQFASKAVYTAVWVAAVSLFVELLGFSTQKWLTAGGLGTVLLTLAGREIFTNFLSSVMIHATRPFVLNEWIQTKIEGYEVSGTVEHVGWWSPTIIRGDDREAVHIPNHKFTVSVVRNLSQKTHWRIKTHLAISHLDVDKINNIVADMRKVLAKNPQVEQQKLHRRVFLDNVDPENQALLILVSCFVKTSHFEEYLCVKEAVLLDLLRIIRHHRARLATPIRTVQKMYGDGDVENIPFSETIFSRTGAAASRPLLLIEHPTKINGEESNKARQAAHANEEQAAKAATADFKSTSSIPEEPLNVNSDKQPSHQKAGSGGGHLDSEGLSEESSGEKQQKDIMTGDAYAKSSKTDPALSPPVSSNSDARRTDSGSDAASLQTKPESERLQAPPSPATTSRTILEDNIVLGVALDGAKRMLPIEEGMSPSSGPVDSKELASLRSASGAGSPTSSKEKKDSSNSAPGGSTVDQRDQEG